MSPDTGPLEFEILGRIFVAPMKTTTNGKISWRFPANDQSSAGIDLEPWDDSLPAHLKVANTKYEFGPVPRRGADRSDNQTNAPTARQHRVTLWNRVPSHLRIALTFERFGELHQNKHYRRNYL